MAKKYWRPGNSPNSSYIPAEFKAQTLDELREYCGEYGAAAVEDVRCTAAGAWLMHQGASGSNELHLYAEQQRAKLGMPRVDGKPWRPALAHATPTEQQRVTDLALAVLAAWDAAGKPNLGKLIELTQHAVHSAVCLAEQRRGALAAVTPILFPEEQPACPA